MLDPRTLIESMDLSRLWMVLDSSPSSAQRAFVTMVRVYSGSAYSEVEYAQGLE
jgi:hypothetical protein